MDLSIIIINYRTFNLTRDCIKSVHEKLEDENLNYEIIVVDNDSQDGSYEQLLNLEDNKTFVYKTEKNGGFGYGNNYGVNNSRGEFLLFLNSDTLVYNNVFKQMMDYIKKHNDFGALTCLMDDGNKIPLVVGHPFETKKTLFIQTFIKPLVPDFIKKTRAKYNHSLINDVTVCDWISGSCLLMKKDLFLSVGGWNETFFMYMEDEYLCKSISNRGYKIGIYPLLGIQHLVGKSGGSYFSIYQKYRSEILYFCQTYGYRSKLIGIMIYLQAFFSLKNHSIKRKITLIQELRKIE